MDNGDGSATITGAKTPMPSQKLVIPEKVTLKGKNLKVNAIAISETPPFSYKNLTSITIPEGITMLNDYEFTGNPDLTSIIFLHQKSLPGLYSDFLFNIDPRNITVTYNKKAANTLNLTKFTDSMNRTFKSFVAK